jgi:hypothetical protein
MKTGFAENAIIKKVLREAFFQRKDNRGITHANSFSPIPLTLIALILTAVRHWFLSVLSLFWQPLYRLNTASRSGPPAHSSRPISRSQQLLHCTMHTWKNCKTGMSSTQLWSTRFWRPFSNVAGPSHYSLTLTSWSWVLTSHLAAHLMPHLVTVFQSLLCQMLLRKLQGRN